MSKMQRDKGARYERWCLSKLRRVYGLAVRGNQTMGAFQPDIVCPDYWVECTHGKAPRVYAKIKQVNKDLTECDMEHRGKTPLIVHRKNNCSDWATIPFDHLLDLLELQRQLTRQVNSGQDASYHMKNDDTIDPEGTPRDESEFPS